MPLDLDVAVWSAVFKLTDYPLVTLWPNKSIVESLKSLGIKLNTSNEPLTFYGHIVGSGYDTTYVN